MTEKKSAATKGTGKKAVKVTKQTGVEAVDAGSIDGVNATPVAAPKPISERRQRQIDAEIEIATSGAEATMGIIEGLANSIRAEFARLTDSRPEGDESPAPTLAEFDKLADDASIKLKQAKVSVRALKTALRAGHNAPAIAGLLKEGEDAVEEISKLLRASKAEASELRKVTSDADKEARKQRREANRQPKVNGVRKPADGTICGNVWVLIEAIGAALGQHAPVAYVLSEGLARGYDANTLKTQYARWKKYNGLDGEIKLPLPPLDIDVPHAPANAAAGESADSDADADVDALLAAKPVQPWDADTASE